jgi:hypothetical protein
MEVSKVRRPAIVGALCALTLHLAPLHAQRVAFPPATETYGSQTREQPREQARDWSADVPAHISSVSGSVTLEREGKLEPAEANVPLLSGDRLRTSSASRVEVLFSDGSTFTLDEESDLDVLSESLVRLLEGKMRLMIVRATTTLDYRVDAPTASVWIRAAGDYRLSARARRSEKPEVVLTVLRGSAELVNEHGKSTVRAGQEALATPDLAPSLAYDVNSAATSEFDSWTQDQRDARVGTTSVSYLPSELSYESGTFDNYGSWDYQAPYGYVWYPRVAVGWRPYWQGRWTYSNHFNWFWVGIHPWSWATHHYGRWGISNAGWYWIPGRAWSPAWVSWGNAPGYVGWCPLGYNNYPVIGFHSTGGYYSPWSAWTVVPRTVWAPNIWVTSHVVIPTAVPPVAHARFVEVPVAPVPTVGFANIQPIRAPTLGYSVARYARPVPVGEEWRERSPAANVAAPRNNTVIGAGSPRDLTDRSRVQQGDATEASVPRATPSRSRLAGAASPPRSTAIDVPQIDVPTVDAPRAGRNPSRAVMPPGSDPTAPPNEDVRTSGVMRAAPRVDPYASPISPAAYGRSAGREPSRVPQAGPPNPAVRQPGPDRAVPRSTGRPDSPAAGPTPATAPASPSHGPSRIAPSSPPPSSAAPPPAAGARSSGSAPTGGAAVPRSRGGGGL